MHFVVSFICGFIYDLQNKILHSRLEALHIQLAERDRHSAGMPSGSTGTDTLGDSGLQNVINYLRRSKEIVSLFFLSTSLCLCLSLSHTHTDTRMNLSVKILIFGLKFNRQKQRFLC